MNRPNLFIVGAPKSGTTALYTYLQSHPQIFMSPLKEPYYFGDDLLHHSAPRPSENEYLALFQGAAEEVWLGESSVTGLISKSAAQEIHDFNSAARIIIMLRNPVDMMYSMHSQTQYTGAETEKEFSRALALEEPRRQGRAIPAQVAIVNLLFYRELGHYADQVRRYLRVFGRENVHVIIFDDFRADVASEYRDLLRFLEVDDTFEPSNFQVVNANKRRRNERLRQVIVNPDVVAATRRLIPSRAIRQRIAGRLMFLIIKEERRPPMDPALRCQLQEELLPDVEQLSSLLGRDLTHWCRP